MFEECGRPDGRTTKPTYTIRSHISLKAQVSELMNDNDMAILPSFKVTVN